MAINAEIDHEYQSPKKEEGKLLKLENQDGADYHTQKKDDPETAFIEVALNYDQPVPKTAEKKALEVEPVAQNPADDGKGDGEKG